jgi:hypothetical protein
MARENQGLQIALIIFVMLTIILGVTTYVFVRKWDDATKEKVAAEKVAGDKGRDAEAKEQVANALKKLIGVAATEALPNIEDTFRKDMERYGAAYAVDDRFYRLLLEKMQKTIEELGIALKDAKDEVPKLRDEHKQNLEAQEAQIARFKAERDKAEVDLTTEQTKYRDDVERKNREGVTLQASLQAARKEMKERIDKIEVKFQEAVKKTKTLEEVNVVISDENQGLKGAVNAGTANGEVTWVNQRSATVWINLGRADGLTRQVTFSVYPADVTDLTAKDARKGKIEVTQILGDHLAEARVLEDEITRPIMPEDKIFTPVWNSGMKRHFALVGFLDIDGDGKSDLETVKHIIAINGGVVDCYVDPSGKQVGQINVNTNCLVLGERLTEKNDTRQLNADSKIRNEADQYRLQKVQLGDLLQRMGWKNVSPVVRYGRGANVKDFQPKVEELPRKSTGNVSDLFEKRQPPKQPASAY